MADIYVRSTDGLAGDNGSTWALAKDKCPTGPAPSDNIYLSKVHSETTAAGLQIVGTGAINTPTKIICVDDTSDPVPPTAVATGAVVNVTGAGATYVAGNLLTQGVAFNIGNAAANFVQVLINNSNNAVPTRQRHINSDFNLVDTHPSSYIQIGSSTAGASSDTQLDGCRFKLANTNQYIALYGGVRINGGSFMAGTSVPSPAIFKLGNGSRAVDVLVENFDFSAMGSAMVLFAAPNSGQTGRVIVRNCKMPTGWVDTQLMTGAITETAIRIEMYNCDDGATNNKQRAELLNGSLKQETVVVKTGGASDGTNLKSLKLTSNANVSEATGGLASPLISDWIDTAGAAKTVTVDIIHDSATPLTDAEVWLEVDYLGSSATPQGNKASSKRATILTTAANVTASTATWTTTGLTTPNKQKLSVTFTPQMKGEFLARVVLAKTSKTIYVDPVAQVS